ncbi:MAG TPA: FAD-dependent oxidoreductase [Actinoplanes sp.]|jgi:NADPH-dependent 2,4-dienoyl-CoA reductase/sulfur reductase-like enzyme
MVDNRTFVVVGAGLAGAKAAQTLREEGFDGRLVLIGAEPERPYERPPLSKELLLGKADRESVHVHEAGWYADNDVDLRTGTGVCGVDRAHREAVLTDGRRVRYDALLLATGAVPRRLPVPGTDLDGILQLRTLSDADRIAEAAVDGAHLVIVGAGWIGLEVAAAARQRGAAVTVVETADLPLQRVLGDEIAAVFRDLHSDHGVTFRFGAHTRGFQGTDRVSHVVLADGTALPADAVLVAVGVRPADGLARDAGLRVGNGIAVDRRLRTDDPYIYAAGDVANVDHPVLGARVRVEHWANALHSGPVAARSMLGREVSYERLPYFYTDQYDLGMEYTGWVAPGADARVVVRGDLRSREFVAFWMVDGRVAAGMNVNVWDVSEQIQALVRAGFAGRRVDPADLADPAVDLAGLAS